MKKIILLIVPLLLLVNISFADGGSWESQRTINEGTPSLCSYGEAIEIDGEPSEGSSNYYNLSRNGSRYSQKIKENPVGSSWSCYEWIPDTNYDDFSISVNGEINSDPFANTYANNTATVSVNYNGDCGPGVNCEQMKLTRKFGSNTYGPLSLNGDSDSFEIDISDLEENESKDLSIKVETLDTEIDTYTVDEVYKRGVYPNSNSSNLSYNSDFDSEKMGDDNSTFGGWISLEDDYGNAIVPNQDINRTIKVSWRYDNSVYLDQLEKNGSGIRYKSLGETYQSGVIGSASMDKTYDYNDLSELNSNSNKYSINIKSYVPTNAGYVYATGDIKIKSVDYEIEDNVVGSANWSKDINKRLKFKPIIKGEINNLVNLADEGQKGDFFIDLIPEPYYVSDKMALQFYYSSDNKPISPILGNDTNSHTGDYYGEISMFFGDNNFDSFNNFYGGFDLTNTNNIENLYHEFKVKTGSYLENTNNRGSLYTYYIYNYDDVGSARWRSDFRASETGELTKDIGVFVDGLTSIDDLGEKHQMLTGDNRDVNISISRSDLRNYFSKKTYELTKGRDYYNVSNGSELNSLNDDCVSCFDYKDTTIYYMDGDTIINDLNDINKDVIIIAEGGNIRIKNDLNPNGNGNLGLIALRDKEDEDWDESGNIYIDTNVTQVHAFIYGDGGMMSYDDQGDVDETNDKKGYEINYEKLRNQLYINGVLRTYNTLGGANSENACPYFVEDCTETLARSFDLEYGRTFHLISADLLADISTYPDAGNYWIPVANQGYTKQAKLVGGDTCKYDKLKTTGCNTELLGSKIELTDMEKGGFDSNEIKNKLAPIYIKYNSDISTFPVFGE